MIPYLILFLVLIVEIVIFYIIPILKPKKKILFNIMFIELFLFLALRDKTVGCDMPLYLIGFNNAVTSNTLSISNFVYNWEPLFIFYNKLIALITNNEQTFVAITAFIGLVGPYLFIKRYSKSPCISTVLFVGLYLFAFHFFALRQIIAISILLCSVKYIEEKKHVKFLALLILAILFHKSSIIFAVVYLLSMFKHTKTFLRVLCISTIAIFIFGKLITFLLVKILYNQYTGIISFGGYNLLIIMLLILAFLVIFDNNKEKTRSKIILYNMYFITIILQILTIQHNSFARLIITLFVSVTVLIPNAIESCEKISIKNKTYLYILLLLCVAGYYCYSVVTDQFLVNYRFLWN